jgi:hypothetical protein
MHKDKNFALLPLSSVNIRKHFRDLANNAKNNAATSDSSNVNKHDAIF